MAHIHFTISRGESSTLSSTHRPDIDDAKDATPSCNVLADGSLFLSILLQTLGVADVEAGRRQGGTSQVFATRTPHIQEPDTNGAVNSQHSLASLRDVHENANFTVGSRANSSESTVVVSENTHRGESMRLSVYVSREQTSKSETLERAQSSKGESSSALLQAPTAVNEHLLTAFEGPESIQFHEVERLAEGSKFLRQSGLPLQNMREFRLSPTLQRADFTAIRDEAVEARVTSMPELEGEAATSQSAPMSGAGRQDGIDQAGKFWSGGSLLLIEKSSRHFSFGKGQEASVFASPSQGESRRDVNARGGRSSEIVMVEKESNVSLSQRTAPVSVVREKAVDVLHGSPSEHASVNIVAMGEGNSEGKENEVSRTLVQRELLLPARDVEKDPTQRNVTLEIQSGQRAFRHEIEPFIQASIRRAASRPEDNASTDKPFLSPLGSSIRPGLEQEMKDGKSADEITLALRGKEDPMNEKVSARSAESKSTETRVDETHAGNESSGSTREWGEHVAQVKPGTDQSLVGKIQIDKTHHPASVFNSQVMAADKPESGELHYLSNPSPELSRDVVRQLVKGFSLQVEEKASEMRLALKPPSLGDVVLRVRMDEGKLAAQIEVNHDCTKAVLEASLPYLRDGLAARGIEVDRIDVFMAGQAFSRESEGQTAMRPRSASGGKRRAAPDDVQPYRSIRLMGYNTIEYIM